MGKIQVGQKSPKTVDMGGFTIAPREAAVTNNDVSAEEKAKQLEIEKKNARAARLAEIQAMDEQEQLPLLLEEGFEDEAKALSEKLADLGGETTEHTDTEGESQGGGNGDGGSSGGDNGDDAAGDQGEEKPKKTSERKTSAKKSTTKKK